MAFSKLVPQALRTVLFKRFGLYLTWLYSSPLTLDLDRCKQKDVLRTVNTARSNHPGVPIIILTDATLPPVPGTKRISAVRDLETAPIPNVVVLACNSDELALAAVKFIEGRKGMFYYGADRRIPAARYFHRDEAARLALKETGEADIGYYDLPDFENIAQAIHATRRLAGDYVEIGVYKGNSAYFALSYMERKGFQRRAWFLDTFSGFDYDSAAASADRIWLNTHTDGNQKAIQQLLTRFKIPHEVTKANIITDNLPETIETIAVCNIDVDMCEAVSAALVKVAPLMAQGGIMIVEDQGHTPLLIGAYAAVMDFLESAAGKNFVPVEMTSGQMFLIKAFADRS